MQLFESLSAVPLDFPPTAVAIGKFDGVHAGHRSVIAELIAVSAERGLASTVVTFDRHPLAVLRPENCPPPLISNNQKIDLLEQLGVSATVMLPFTRELSERDANDFVRHVLVDSLRAKAVLVGTDFRFGAGGRGTVHVLRELGQEYGFDVHTVGDVMIEDGRRASSTWIRELLADGRVTLAAELLGRLPTIRSVVVPGEQRGRTLGYPTANLSPDVEGFIPADGVYAAYVTIGDDRFPAAVSIGNNPTFDGIPDKQVEAHLLDQKIDLYGKRIDVSFVQFIRGMRKFPGAVELAEQMRADEQAIRVILGVQPRA